MSEIVVVASPVAGDGGGETAIGVVPQDGTEESGPPVSLGPSLQQSPMGLPDSPLWGERGKAGKVGGANTQNSDYGGYGDLYPPAIYNFIAIQLEGGGWLITGQVVDNYSTNGLTVSFGGLLEGYSITTNEDGSFEFVYLFPPNTIGFVTAVATDVDGLQSEEAACTIG